MSAAEALAPEQSVDEVRESLSVTEKGQPANTIGNCRTVFCHDPLLRGAIRLNLLTDRVDIVRDLGWRRNTSALTDTDVKYLLLYFEQNYGLTSEKKMTAALSIVANENCYHPIQDVLNGLVWDGTPRIRSCLHHFLGAEVSDYVEEMLKHFLLGAIRRRRSPWDYNAHADMDAQALAHPDLLLIYSTELVNDMRMFPDTSQGVPQNLTFWAASRMPSAALQPFRAVGRGHSPNRQKTIAAAGSRATVTAR